jgi:hypothetical protein
MWRGDDLDTFVDEAIADLDRWLSLDDADIDEYVYPVIQAPVTTRGRPVFQRLEPDIEGDTRRMGEYLFPRRIPNARGIWVHGPRSKARRIARRLGLHRITETEQHGRGQPHIHGYAADGRRSQHIFYGPAPAVGQNFFD